MLRRLLLALSLLACLASMGCAQQASVALTRWELVVPGREEQEVTLPAKLALPDESLSYVLRAAVDVPPSMRGRPASIVLTGAFARARLRIDGVPALSCLPMVTDRYRTDGAQCWHFVPPVGAGTLQLELSVEHTTPLTSLFDAAPELVAAPDGGAHFQAVTGFDDATEIGSAFVAGLLGIFYAAAYLFDRSRKVHLWFAAQAFGGLAYPLWWLGVLQPVLGYADRWLLVESMLGAGLMSLYFTHTQLGLGPVPRAWRWLVGFGALTGFAQIAAFPPPVIPLVTAAVISLPTLAVVVLCARTVLRSGFRATPVVIGITWLGILLGAPLDVPALVGLPTPGGGLRLMSFAFALVGLGQGALLARQHVTSLRDADALNAELRRQVADRSRELAEALSQLESPGTGLHAGAIVAGRYRVVRTLGAGGMGEVYEVQRLADGKRFALKVLLGRATRDQLTRLAREGQIAANIDHPNLVAVNDVDVTTEHGLFVVMELVDGGSLAEQRARYGDRGWALRILEQVTDGLVALHAAGVVHRDLKPANILVTSDGGTAKISDFGVSSLAEARVSALADTLAAGGGVPHAGRVTRTGVMLGTPQYMAPELAGGSHEPSPSVDVFALGILAYELLGAGYPFAAPPIVDAIYGRALKRAGALAGSDLPASLVALLDACLEVDPAKRPTAKAVREALR
jgi:hypothetical protein